MSAPCVCKGIDAYLLYQYKDKEDKYAIGSIERDRFIEVNETDKDVVLQTIQLMDGKHDFEEIKSEILKNTGRSIDSEELYNILKKANLISEEDNPEAIKTEFETFGLKLIDVKIGKVKKVFKAVSVITYPFFFIAVASLIFSLIFAVINHDKVRNVSFLAFNDNYIINIISIYSFSTISLILHEFAHGIVGSRFGIDPKKLTLSLYMYISPILYIKLPGLYTIRPRKRVMIWLAGVTANSLLFSWGLIASIILQEVGASELTINIVNYIWYTNLSLIFLNLCPLMPLDGYFILATLLKIPNLRRSSFALIKKTLKTKTMHLSVGQFIYVSLSILAMSYVMLNEIIMMIITFITNLHSGVGVAFWSIRIISLFFV